MEKQIQKDFFRLIRVHDKIHDLVREEQLIIKLLKCELQAGCRYSLPVYQKGTTENTILDELLDVKLDKDIELVCNIFDKYSPLLFQILDQEINVNDASLDEMDKYEELENAKEFNK